MATRLQRLVPPALSLLGRACASAPLRRLADTLCLNGRRHPKDVVVATVAEAVEHHYREHPLEAALAARQAKVYQRIFFRQKLRSLRGKRDARSAAGGVATVELDAALEHFASESNRLRELTEPEAIIGHLARYYIEDMAADFDPAFFIAFRSIARRIFPNFVRSIRVSEARPGTLDQLRRRMGSEPVFILPNHVSNADHVPLCFALNAVGAWQPCIAAGANLFRGISAFLMPRLNAYKIRREHIGAESQWFYNIKWFHNPVYRRVHTEYLHYLWEHNEPFLFYIEGTRSRDGQIGRPKTGIVEDLCSFVARRGRPAHLFPVSLSYTVVPEDEEIEASRAGHDISNRDIVAQLTRMDRQLRSYGPAPIHVRFDAPLEISGHTGDAEAVAERVVGRIRAGTVPTATSVAAAAMVARGLAEPEAVFDPRDLRAQWDEDWRVLAQRLPDGDPPPALEEGLGVLRRRGFIRWDDDGTRYRVCNAPLISQYANRLAHLLEGL